MHAPPDKKNARLNFLWVVGPPAGRMGHLQGSLAGSLFLTRFKKYLENELKRVFFWVSNKPNTNNIASEPKNYYIREILGFFRQKYFSCLGSEYLTCSN